MFLLSYFSLKDIKCVQHFFSDARTALMNLVNKNSYYRELNKFIVVAHCVC